MGSSLPFFTVLVRLVSERLAVSRALSPGDGLSCPLIEGAFSAAVPIRVGSMIHSVQKRQILCRQMLQWSEKSSEY